MKETKLGERFFDSTRGRIVSLLRSESRTVNELAEELDLTDNAVRAHLLTLERDGLVKQGGIQRGRRKPHFAYELTTEAESLFPKSYDMALNVLLSVLKERMTPETLGDVLKEVGREVGRKAAAAHMPANTQGSNLLAKVEAAAKVLEALGGAPRLVKEGDKIIIQSGGCPFATAVESHPEMCSVAETLVAQITGGRVREKCDNTDVPPRCSFEVAEKKKR
ncbi:MAG TPA: ArsR family transcriptional regulator [Blastocatellia bacterium]|jgi:predicted ArsR family transcriptional regulator|nr:ArsR family transcriptional regulator [Blastocatellia bacterium]